MFEKSVSVSVHLCTHAWGMCVFTCINVSICMYVCVSISLSVCVCVCMCVCVCVCVYVCVCVCMSLLWEVTLLLFCPLWFPFSSPTFLRGRSGSETATRTTSRA